MAAVLTVVVQTRKSKNTPNEAKFLRALGARLVRAYRTRTLSRVVLCDLLDIDPDTDLDVGLDEIVRKRLGDRVELLAKQGQNKVEVTQHAPVGGVNLIRGSKGNGFGRMIYDSVGDAMQARLPLNKFTFHAPFDTEFDEDEDSSPLSSRPGRRAHRPVGARV